MRILTLPAFDTWISRFRDRTTRARIFARIRRLADGNPGDHRGVGEGVIELRIDFGPGYRVYYVQRGDTLVVLLCGGDKDTQAADIERSKLLAQTIGDEE